MFIEFLVQNCLALVGLTEALTAVAELRPVVGVAITGPSPCMASPLFCSWQAFSLQYVSRHFLIFTQFIPGQKLFVVISMRRFLFALFL